MDFKLVLVWGVCLFGLPLLVQGKYLAGAALKHYDNPEGRLKDGRCCDIPGDISKSCPPDLCDTVLEACLIPDRDESKQYCVTFPVVENDNSFAIGKLIGNGDSKSTSTISNSYGLKPRTLSLVLTAFEESVDSSAVASTSDIAKFTPVVIDWHDIKFPPKYRRYNLSTPDSRVQVTADFFSVCSKGETDPACD